MRVWEAVGVQRVCGPSVWELPLRGWTGPCRCPTVRVPVGLAWLLGPWQSQAPVEQDGPCPDPGDLFPGLFSVPPPAGPLGSVPQKRHCPLTTRSGCGPPSCASVHGACSASPGVVPALSPLCWVAYPPTWTSVQSELCDVCFRGSGSVRASVWGRALAFRGCFLPFFFCFCFFFVFCLFNVTSRFLLIGALPSCRRLLLEGLVVCDRLEVKLIFPHAGVVVAHVENTTTSI